MVKESLKLSKGQKTLAHFFKKPQDIPEKKLTVAQPKPKIRPKSELFQPREGSCEPIRAPNSQVVQKHDRDCFYEDLLIQPKRFAKTKYKSFDSTFTFPFLLKFPIVAKFLCSYGKNENIINFDEPHEFFLEREPQNQYDQRAIKVAVQQLEKYLLLKGVERAINETEIAELEEEPVTLYLGYVPKDISYNLSVLLDNQQIF
jgi:hypothetical protein